MRFGRLAEPGVSLKAEEQNDKDTPSLEEAMYRIDHARHQLSIQKADAARNHNIVLFKTVDIEKKIVELLDGKVKHLYESLEHGENVPMIQNFRRRLHQILSRIVHSQFTGGVVEQFQAASQLEESMTVYNSRKTKNRGWMPLILQNMAKNREHRRKNVIRK
jgi:hypothetical protein